MQIPFVRRSSRGPSRSGASGRRAGDVADVNAHAILIQGVIDAVDALVVVASP
jgi:hypothetical protein